MAKKKLKILISQPAPAGLHSPFTDLADKLNLNMSFQPFVKVEGETVKNIRIKKINIPSYSALILTSRNAVNHYFRICDEMRITVPNSMKYFCISEAVSYYLQKYIAYRKRKIYSSNNDFGELVEIMKKHENDNFLLVSSNFIKEDIITQLDASEIKYTRGTFFKTVSSDLSKLKISKFDFLVFYTPRDIDSLYENFPKFEQKDIQIAVFGKTTYEYAIQKGLHIAIAAPSKELPSMSMALHSYFTKTK
tara:strand:+ start:2232 stop:2978 length:747 start_codon:yes stop_codon:yes gene_type:complete